MDEDEDTDIRWVYLGNVARSTAIRVARDLADELHAELDTSWKKTQSKLQELSGIVAGLADEERKYYG